MSKFTKIPLKHHSYYGGCDHKFNVLVEGTTRLTNDQICPGCLKRMVLFTEKKSYLLSDMNLSGTNIVDYLDLDDYFDSFLQNQSSD